MKPLIRIDLRDPKWSSLLPDSLPAFRIEEMLRPCTAYPTGLFPGAQNHRENDRKQSTRVERFDNYVEFSKVVDDEVASVGGALYLTTRFYDRRKEGWRSKEKMKKPGEVVAYCINGNLYCSADEEMANATFFDVVYRSLVGKEESFLLLKSLLSEGEGVEFTGVDDYFAKELERLVRS